MGFNNAAKTAQRNACRWAFCALALAFALAIGATGQAHAAQAGNGLVAGSQSNAAEVEVGTQYKARLMTSETLWAGQDPSECAINIDEKDSVTITKAVSQNKRVLGIVKKTTSDSESYYCLKPLRAGTSKVTVTYKIGGKTKTVSGTYTVKKYPNVIKSITVNGKKAPIPTASKPIGYGGVYELAKNKVTVKAQIADGWNLDSMDVEFFEKGALEGDSWAELKNGGSFNLPANLSGDITFSLSNGEDGFVYVLSVSHDKPLELANGNCYIGLGAVGANFTQMANGVKVTKVKSSRPKVLKVAKNADPGNIKLTGLKSGTSTVAITYKYNGKTYTTKAKYKVAKSPLKSLKLNGKKIALHKGWSLRYDSYTHRETNWKSKSKLTVVPADGWSIKYFTLYNGATEKTVKMKSGTTVKTPRKKGAYYHYEIILRNKAGKEFGIGINLSE